MLLATVTNSIRLAYIVVLFIPFLSCLIQAGHPGRDVRPVHSLVRRESGAGLRCRRQSSSRNGDGTV